MKLVVFGGDHDCGDAHRCSRSVIEFDAVKNSKQQHKLVNYMSEPNHRTTHTSHPVGGSDKNNLNPT
jgi:hypothetical protein